MAQNYLPVQLFQNQHVTLGTYRDILGQKRPILFYLEVETKITLTKVDPKY